MREILQQEDPTKLKIPTDSAIRQVVSMLAQKQKSNSTNSQNRDDDDQDDENNVGRRRGKSWDKLNTSDNNILEDVVDEYPTSSPEMIYQEWKERCIARNYADSYPNLPEKKIIKVRIGYLKGKLKKEQYIRS